MKTMNEAYGDGSNHACCPECGFCVPCGDCVCSKTTERLVRNGQEVIDCAENNRHTFCPKCGECVVCGACTCENHPNKLDDLEGGKKS